jgi:hypothetical protein
VRTGWADVLLNCFSPFAQEEFLRVLRPGGRLIYAVPGAEHLFQMKAVLYEKPYRNPVQEVEYPGFEAIGEREVSGSITVPAGQLEALFAMTPYYWKTPRDGAARLAALPELTTDISFRFLVFETNLTKKASAVWQMPFSLYEYIRQDWKLVTSRASFRPLAAGCTLEGRAQGQIEEDDDNR